MKLPGHGGKPLSLRECVQAALEQYFTDLKGHEAENIYAMVIGEVAKAILETVMQQAQGNQTHAAQMLGINRSTLRKKLKLHDVAC